MGLIVLFWVTSEPFDRALDDLVGDAAMMLETLDISPVAIGPVTVSANLAEQAGDAVVARMQVALAKLPKMKQVVCAECFSVRSEVKDGQWVVTRGLVDRDSYQRIGKSIGAKTFVLLHLDWIQNDTLALEVRVIAAHTGLVQAAKRIHSHETTAALRRSNARAEQTDTNLRAELERLIEGKPKYAHAVTAGYWYLPITRGEDFGFGTVTAAYRLYEQFGPSNALTYGFQLNFFITPGTPLIVGGAITGLFGGTVTFQNTLIPRLRLLAQAGAFVAGPHGNTFMLGGLAEVITRLGLGITAGAQYFVNGLGTQGKVGGGGFIVGANYVFE